MRDMLNLCGTVVHDPPRAPMPACAQADAQMSAQLDDDGGSTAARVRVRIRLWVVLSGAKPERAPLRHTA